MSDTTPPPVGPRGLAIRCAIQGRDAYAAGVPLIGCPYGPARPFSRRAWVAGWAAAQPSTVEPDDVDVDAPWPADTPV